MNVSNFKYIHFVRFCQLNNWSVQYAVEHKMNFTHKYPMVRIGSFLSRNTDRINVQDDVLYKRITVKTNNGGVSLRDEVMGSSIGTKKQTVVKSGQFIVSKIDARNGAFGIIPKELDGAIVTQDFPTFNVDNSKVYTQFLVLVSTTPTFIEFAKSCSSGTTNRKRMNVEEFLDQMIPLPSIEIQKSLLTSYNQKQCQAQEYEAKAREIENSIEPYILNKLGFKGMQTMKTKKREKYRFISFANFKDLDRWDFWNIKDYINLKGKFIYPVVQLADYYNFILRTWDKSTETFKYIEISSVDSHKGIEKANIFISY